MYPQPRRDGIDAFLTNLIRLAVFALICYLGITTLIGFQLGRQVYQAKTNPLIGLGSEMVGRAATESFAIHQANLSAWVTASPTFWIAMRISE